MASEILFLPFRRSQPVSLTAAIKQYILAKYGQHPDMFTNDLEAIDKLRTDAINVQEAHTSGIKKLMTYAAQLTWISRKFPIDIGVEFVWYPALGYNTKKPESQHNIRFELANIIFNIASLYSHLVFSTNRTTSEDLKEASNYSCRAAGVISYLKDEIIPDMRSMPTGDMDEMTLGCLQQLLLAQAQECYWQKAVMDGYRDASIAKLAAQLSDYYSIASDFAVKSDAISSEWIHHMTAKHHHFAAVAQFRASRDCLDKRRYGEEVARLRDGLACVNEASREARYISKIMLGDLQTLKARLTEDLRRAEKDNDVIYLEPVPPKSELKLLDRANMALIKTFSDMSKSLLLGGDSAQLGKPLFAKLVPYSVHVAASIYNERRDRLINYSIIEPLQALDIQLHELLESLNLPGSLQAIEKSLGLPPGIMAHAEEVRQQGGLGRIITAMNDVATVKASNQAIYREGVGLLQQEAEEDDRLRAKYGTDRWTRLLSREVAVKLYAHADEIAGYFNSAQSSDELVEKKIKTSEEMINLLAASRRELEAFVPNTQRMTVPPNLEKESTRLKGILNESSRLEARRRKLMDGVKSKVKMDDINPELLHETARLEQEYPMQKVEAVQFENLFEQRLQTYEPYLARVADEQEEQDRVAARLQEAHANFVAARIGDTSIREREQALQKLENAYFKYKELISNIDVGRKFYNDLAKIIARFQDDCGNFVRPRRHEAERLQNDLSMSMAALNVSHEATMKRPPQQEHRYGAPASNLVPTSILQQPIPHSVTASASPHPPVTPTPATPGTWTPNMGIKFGGPPPGSQRGGGGVASYPRPQPSHHVDQWDPDRKTQFR